MGVCVDVLSTVRKAAEVLPNCNEGLGFVGGDKYGKLLA